MCSPSQVQEQVEDLGRVLEEFQAPDVLCKDFKQQCAQWKDEGMCESKPEVMKYECRITCRYCDSATGHVLKDTGLYY